MLNWHLNCRPDWSTMGVAEDYPEIEVAPYMEPPAAAAPPPPPAPRPPVPISMPASISVATAAPSLSNSAQSLPSASASSSAPLASSTSALHPERPPLWQASSTSTLPVDVPLSPLLRRMKTGQASTPQLHLDTELARKGSNFGLPIALQLTRVMGGAVGILSVRAGTIWCPSTLQACRAQVVLRQACPYCFPTARELSGHPSPPNVV